MSDVVLVNPFSNVGASSLAQTKYTPPSQQSSLFGFILKLGGTFDETDIDSVRIRAPGGKDLIPQISGADWRDMWEYEGGSWPTSSAYFPIMFGDPFALTKAGRHVGNFDHSVYPGDMTIEVAIGSGASSPTLEAYALVDPPKALMGLGYQPGEILRHRAIIETVLTPGAAVSLQSVPIGIGSSAGALLRRVFLKNTKLTSLRVKKEGLVIWDDIPTALATVIQQDIYARVPQSGVYVYDRIADGSQREAGTTVNREGRVFNWQFEITTSASDTITARTDVLIALPQL